MQISLGTTYYNNPDFIIKFINNHKDAFDELIIVDDGSFEEHRIDKYVSDDKKIKLYRVKKDYGFNSHGCRNLIMKEASSEFVVLIDSDRKIIDSVSSLAIVKQRKLSLNTLYKFIAHTARLGNQIHDSVNDFLISKTYFFSAGGYDEEIIGFRTGDREYFKQLRGKEAILPEINIILTRMPTNFMPDKIIKSPFDKNKMPYNLSKLIERRQKTPDPNKPILTFEWERLQ